MVARRTASFVYTLPRSLLPSAVLGTSYLYHCILYWTKRQTGTLFSDRNVTFPWMWKEDGIQPPCQ